MRRFLEKVSNAWQGVTVDLREVTAAPNGRLLAVEGWHMQDQNGIELETMVITIYAFRDGLVAQLHGFLDRPTALEALARRNEAMPQARAGYWAGASRVRLGQNSNRPWMGILSRMRKLKQAAVVSGVLGLLAGVAAWLGPFISPEAVEGLLERMRRSFPRRRRPQLDD